MEQHKMRKPPRSSNVFQKGMSKIGFWLATKRLKKEDFLQELKDAWAPIIKKNTDIEKEVKAVISRIAQSGYKDSFDKVGVTEDDIRTVLQEIKDEKPLPTHVEKTPNRNDPCPCGSGKKYKRCCGG